MQRRKFVVVGAGQIGGLLVEQLASRGDEVVVVTRTKKALRPGVTHVARDISTDALDDVFAGADAVLLAVNAPYSAKVWAATLPNMQRRVVDACVRTHTKLVVLENLYMHGPHKEPLREDLPQGPVSKKGLVRQQMTNELFARRHELRVAAVRPSDFWGPGLNAVHLDDKAISGIIAGKRVQAIGDLDALHARSFANDVATAMLLIAQSDDADVWGRVWHPPVIHATTRQMVSALAAAAGVKDPGVRSLPRWAVGALGLVVPFLKELEEMLYQWDRPYLVDDSAFCARFGVSATSLSEGARACVAVARSAPARSAA